MPTLIDTILDEMERTRETRYSRKERPQIRQFDGFRSDWAEYVTLFIDEYGNIDRG